MPCSSHLTNTVLLCLRRLPSSSAGSKTNISPEAFAKRAFDMLQADRKSWSHKTLVRMDPDPNNDPSSQIEHFIMQAQEHGGAAVDVWGLALIL